MMLSPRETDVWTIRDHRSRVGGDDDALPPGDESRGEAVPGGNRRPDPSDDQARSRIRLDRERVEASVGGPARSGSMRDSSAILMRSRMPGIAVS